MDEEAENPPTFSDPYEERRYLKHRLALVYRVFAKHGLAKGVAGHITLRDPVDPTSFWVKPFGTHFSLIRDEDLIRLDHAGKVVEGEKNKRLNYGRYTFREVHEYVLTDVAAFANHAEIRKARPDVICAAHSHRSTGAPCVPQDGHWTCSPKTSVSL